MEKDDDAPEDVKRATSIEREIKKGEKDDTFEGYPRVEENKKRWEHCDKPLSKKSKRQKKKSNGDCCTKQKEKRKEAAKLVEISVFGKPCTFPKLHIVPRHCLTKQGYINLLATKSRRCPPDCRTKTVLRKLKPVSPRIKELAQPKRQQMLMTLQQGAAILPPALLDNLVRTLENETCITPEQATIASHKKKFEKKKKEKKDKWRYKEKHKWKKPSVGIVGGMGSFDKDSVFCQYLIAERFVKSILKWKCPIPKSEFNDVSEVIVKRLVDVLEYTLPQNEDRKSQQLRFLADVIACWISGVLSEVAQNREKKLEERCKKKEDEMKAIEKDDDDDDDDEDEEEDKDDGLRTTYIEYEGEDEEIEWKEDEKERKQDRRDKVEKVRRKAEGVEEETEKDEIGVETEDVKVEVVEEQVGTEPETEVQEVQNESSEAQTEEEPSRVETEMQTKTEEETAEEIEAEAKVEVTTETHTEPVVEMATETEVAAKRDTETGGEVEIKGELETDVKMAADADETKMVTEVDETKMVTEENEVETKTDAEEKTGELPIEPLDERTEDLVGIEKDKENGAEGESKDAEEEAPREKETEEIVESSVEPGKTEGVEKEAPSGILEEEKVTPEKAIAADVIVAEDLEELFKTDLPFLTFGKIIDTVYKMIENVPENTGEDPITNGIHRAIYEKLSNIVTLENPDLLTEELKDVMDVVCGKIANWLRTILSKSQIAFMERYLPVVESKEIRDWTRWLTHISDAAIDWNIWLRSVIEKVFDMEGARITRGEWRDWTKSVDTGALLWRRFHLQTIHQAHRNITMMIGRRVVKTGTNKIPNNNISEQLIRATDLR